MKIAIAIDRIYDSGSDLKLLNECVSYLKSKGHDVHNCGRGPSNCQNYMLNHTADLMVQVAGGLCIGTLSDFCYGIKTGSYHATKACIPIYSKPFDKTDPYTYVPHGGAHDDNFSQRLPREWFNQFLGRTFPETYKKFSQYLYPYSVGATAQEMMDKMLGGSNSNSTGGGQQGGGGTSGLDLIKQVVTDWDKYGVTLDLNGDTLRVGRAKTSEAIILPEDVIVNDSITLTDYDSNTPNTVTDGSNTIKDAELVERFGTVNYDETIENKGKAWLQDMYQVAQRGHNHQIDLKCLFDPQLHMGMYVKLNLPTLDIENKYYYVTKTSIEEESCMSLTLEPAPPSRYQEVTETNVDLGDNKKSGGDMIQIGNDLAAKYGFCALKARDPGAKGGITSNYPDMKRSGCGDCHAWSDALYTELNAVGIKTRIIEYNNGYVNNHRSVQIYKNGTWEDYPYRSTNISKYARAQASKSGMYVWKNAP